MVQYSQTFRDENPKEDSFTEVTLIKVVLMARSTTMERNSNPVNLPIGSGKLVRFANADEIKFALGIPEMDNPVPAGIIENGDGSSIPVFLDISYLLYPSRPRGKAL